MYYQDITLELTELIQMLQDVKERGGKTVIFNGTILVPETGNEIVISNEPQW